MSAPDLKVGLVVCDNSDAEARAIRSALEWFNVRVFTYWIGRGNDLVEILSGRDIYRDSDHLIISGHGDEGNLLMPHVDPGVLELGEPRGNWNPDTVRKYAKLPPLLVFCSACGLGYPEMANAFLDGGARAYIGAADYPHGHAALFIVLRFYYELMSRKCSEREAFERARSQDKDTAMYQWFEI